MITAPERVPVQLDGDPAGSLEAGPEGGWRVEVLPGAVGVLVPAGLTNLLVENTTFGISFIGAAKTSVEKGQCAAMSRNVRLPMMCTPARHTFSMVQAVASLSRLLKIQSSSPFGPPTKPSTETDILRMRFLMAPPRLPIMRRASPSRIDTSEPLRWK